jgi:aspartate aminotransferase
LGERVGQAACGYRRWLTHGGGDGDGLERRSSARLVEDRGNRRVGDPGRRREGQGAQGRGSPCHRVRCGGAGFPTPGAIVAGVEEACADPRNHRFTPAGGLPELRTAIVEKTKRDSGYAIAENEVLVTNGGKQAVYEAFATLLDPGDEVLLPAPYWTTYPEAVALAGGVTTVVVTGPESGYLPSVGQLEAARTQATKVLLWCSPSNPTGAVAPRELTEAVGRWAVANGIWVVTDEIYEHLVYDGAEAVSMPVAAPELADTCVVLNGVAKTYAMTGWRVGWMAAPPDVVKAATNLQSHLSSNVANVSQRAAIAALTGPLDAVYEMRAAFDRRRRAIVGLLSAIPGVQCPVPQGAFYVYPAVGGLLGKQIRGRTITSSLDLAAAVLEFAEVAIVPGEAFGTPGFVRLSYALGDDDLWEGMSRMAEVLGEAS